MADAIVSSVVDKLSSMLVDTAFQEAARLIHFNQNLTKLVDKLGPIRALLSDAYQKSKRNPLIQDWLLDLQDVVYDAEDLFDECQSLPLATVSHPPPRYCCFSCVGPSHLLFRYRMGKRVDKLMNRIAEIEKRSQAFQLVVNANSEPAFGMIAEATLHRTVFLRDESETVGIDGSIAEITSWLSDEGPSHLQPRRRIVVVGMGGIGKTHLLTHVFRTERGKFEKSVWLTISQSYSPKALQEKLGREISLSLEGVTAEEAKDRIFECLTGNKSLLILDDFWSGRHLLDDLGVPDEDRCKVIISTRSRHIAEELKAEIYDMPCLSEENSWRLFCRHAFPTNGVAPEELEAVAREIEGKCRRLPLAIKTVAASMAMLKLPTEWNDALQRLSDVDLSRDVMPVLEISYEALPSHLKLCFLFCSAFPEDYQIKCEFLKALWIGEGIVCGGEMTTPYDVAEGCLNALINLCLIEATDVTIQGRALHCKMHDLLRELALGKSQNEMGCFFQAGKENIELPLQQLSGHRRASLMACGLRITLQNSAGLESLHTLLLSRNPHLKQIVADFLTNLKHLRVLDLSETGISVLPQNLGSLKHLRVLNLSFSNIEELPESVSNLRHLQFLDVSACHRFKKLPLEIGQLKCLTYLDLSDSSIEFLPKAVSLLTSLETLKLPLTYNLLGGNELRFEDLKDLAKLRVFQGRLRASDEVQMVAEGIFGNMQKMRELFLENDNPDIQIRLPSDMERMRELEIVFLRRHVPPDCLSSFQSLVILVLSNCNCEEYPRLDRLPNLRQLGLDDNKSCNELPKEFGRAGGFLKLEELQIWSFQNLEELPELENGAMPMLKRLSIYGLPKLKKMPEGLNQISTLKELCVEHCEMLPESEFEKLRTNLPHLKLEVEC